MRQALSSNHLSDDKVDQLTDDLLQIHTNLPELLRFNEKTWLKEEFVSPKWPLSMLAVLHASKVHNFVTILNRRKKGRGRRKYVSHLEGEVYVTGHERVLMSARVILGCQALIHNRLREGMLCWTQNQQSFNAAVLLPLF